MMNGMVKSNSNCIIRSQVPRKFIKVRVKVQRLLVKQNKL